MGLIKGKCPECGASLKISDKATGQLTCPYCGTEYLVEHAVTNIVNNVTNNVVNNTNIENAIINVKLNNEFVIEYGVLKEYVGESVDVVIPTTVKEIADNAFSEVGIETVIIPNSVRSIGRGVFYKCSSLTSVIIGDSVKSIGVSAFYECSSLTNVTIGKSVRSIDYNAFYGCRSLKNVNISSIEAWLRISFDCFESNPLCYANNLYLNNELLTSITVPKSVTSIGDYAFYHCKSLKSITMGNSVTRIGRVAFSGCSSLSSITIPDSVTSIGDRVFCGCYNLTSITIGEGVTSINDGTFIGCSRLKSIKILGRVKTIGYGAFEDCSSLTSIESTHRVKKIGKHAFKGCSSLRNNPLKKSGCYVATCVYNSYDCPEVWRLRRFRDNYLDNRIWGKAFIKFYYLVAPTLVKWFGNANWFKKSIKYILDKFGNKLRERGYEDTPYNDKF